ncbi:hypothetical protein COT07_03300 [Candidatus Woesearchaeota archaeon CG07_land_8_20_14_0_80_44_23]|nr:MAG: hypothetical protein COT07_03300 [Candidatus Woesearchaeota archaeon CG07_land_8_20_14_0_80_44_23]
MSDEEKIEGEKLQERSFLEHLCYKYFKEDNEKQKLYYALGRFVPLKIPVNPKNPDKPADYDYILHDYFKAGMPQAANYERAALVALLNEDYEKVDEFFSEIKKSNVSENKLLKIYSPIFDNKEKIHELLKQYYAELSTMEPKFDAKSGNQGKSAGVTSAQERHSLGKGPKIAISALAALTIFAAGATLYYAGNANIFRVQNTSLEEQVAKQEEEISNYQTQITSLEEQLASKPSTTSPVVYMREVLTGNETITDEVASYLSGIKGLNYGSLGFAGRINLIADYCKTIYDVMGIPREQASQKTRQLPDNYQFYMPTAKVETENGKWRLKGTYVRKADDKLVNFELKQEKYMDP